MGEDRAILLRLLGRVLPSGVDRLRFGELQEVEGELPLSILRPGAEENRLHQGATQSVPIVGKGNRHAELLPNAGTLAQDDVKHGTVDGVVGAIEESRTHDPRGLAETVDPPLALLVAGGIPGEVVMNDRVEEILEVDALG